MTFGLKEKKGKESKMRPVDFIFWLQGFLELSDAKTLSAKQLTIVRNHLNLVFEHSIDPSLGGDAEKLQAIHDGDPIAQVRKILELSEMFSKDEPICASAPSNTCKENPHLGGPLSDVLKEDGTHKEALEEALKNIREQLSPIDPTGPEPPLEPPLAPPKPIAYHRPSDNRDRRLRC